MDQLDLPVPRVIQDQQVLPAFKDSKALRELRDQMDPPDQLDHLVQQDQRLLLEQDLLDLPVPLGMMGNLDLLVQTDQLPIRSFQY